MNIFKLASIIVLELCLFSTGFSYSMEKEIPEKSWGLNELLEMNFTLEIESLAVLCARKLASQLDQENLSADDRKKLEEWRVRMPKYKARKILHRALTRSLARENAVILENIKDAQSESLLNWEKVKQSKSGEEYPEKTTGWWKMKLSLAMRDHSHTKIGIFKGHYFWSIEKKENTVLPDLGRLSSDLAVFGAMCTAPYHEYHKWQTIENKMLLAWSHNPYGYIVFYDYNQNQIFIQDNDLAEEKIILDKKVQCVPWKYWCGSYSVATNNAIISDDDKYIVLNTLDRTLSDVLKEHSEKKLVDSFYGKTLNVFDAKTGKCLHELKHEEPVYASVFDGRSSVLAAFTRHTIILWDLKTGKQRGKCTHYIDEKELGFEWVNLLTRANKLNNHWRVWIDFLPNNRVAFSASTDSCNVRAPVGLYLYDMEKDKALSYTEESYNNVPYPRYENIERYLSFEELAALITLERQDIEKKIYDKDAWEILSKSPRECLRNLSVIRYVLSSCEQDNLKEKEQNEQWGYPVKQENSSAQGYALTNYDAAYDQDEENNPYADQDSLCSMQ